MPLKIPRQISIKTSVLIYLIFVTLVTTISYMPLELSYLSLKEIIFGYWGHGWDGMHYLRIAEKGYEFPLQAFFPFYPLIIKAVDFILPLSLAERINIFILPFALLTVNKLSHLMKTTISGQISSAIAIVSFPTAFFLQANYTETLFILISGLCLIKVLNKEHFFAAILAATASATKVTGISLGVVLIISTIVDKKSLWKIIGLGLIANLGIIAYFLYLTFAFGSPKIFFDAQSEWSRGLGVSSYSFISYLKPVPQAMASFDTSLYRRLSEVGAVIIAFVLLVSSWRKIDVRLWLYSLFVTLIPISTGSFLSFNRLILSAFPLIIYGYGRLSQNRALYAGAICLGYIMQIIGIYLFHNNVFVG